MLTGSMWRVIEFHIEDLTNGMCIIVYLFAYTEMPSFDAALFWAWLAAIFTKRWFAIFV